MEYNKEKRQNFMINTELISISALWYSQNEEEWLLAEKLYWKQLSYKQVTLEKEIEVLIPDDVQQKSVEDFYIFLHDKYFPWKYTAANRLATTQRQLEKHLNDLSPLQEIQNALFSFDKMQIETGLQIARRINGLGIAGASGLLAILFPTFFGTVDQFMVKSLLCIQSLDQHERLMRMNPEGLTIKDGVVLEQILRAKAAELNNTFKTDEWTPRKIDKILWAHRV